MKKKRTFTPEQKTKIVLELLADEHSLVLPNPVARQNSTNSLFFVSENGHPVSIFHDFF